MQRVELYRHQRERFRFAEIRCIRALELEHIRRHDVARRRVVYIPTQGRVLAVLCAVLSLVVACLEVVQTVERRNIDDIRAHLLGLVTIALDGEGNTIALLYGVARHHKEVARTIRSLNLVTGREARMVGDRVLIGYVRDKAVAEARLTIVAHAVEDRVGKEWCLRGLGGVVAQRVCVIVVRSPLAGLVNVDGSGVLLAVKLGGRIPIKLEPSRCVGLFGAGKAHCALATARLNGDIYPLIDVGNDYRTVFWGELHPTAVVGTGVLVVISDVRQNLDLRFVAHLSIYIRAARGPVVVGTTTGKDKHLEVHLPATQ